MTPGRRDELLAAAAERRMYRTRDGRAIYEGRDVTDEVAFLVDAGHLAKVFERNMYDPTPAGRVAYNGPGRCPDCDAWPRVEWLGERGRSHAYRCANGHRWEIPA